MHRGFIHQTPVESIKTSLDVCLNRLHRRSAFLPQYSYVVRRLNNDNLAAVSQTSKVLANLIIRLKHAADGLDRSPAMLLSY